MSIKVHYFISNESAAVVALPFNINEMIDNWGQLHSIMTRKIPKAFTRDEWAYLIRFLEKENLMQPFSRTFGVLQEASLGKTDYLIKPRGMISLWLPSNVSLLGPLMLILLSLSMNPIRIKGGSKAENLTGIFFDFALEHLPNSSLKSYLKENIAVDFFDRDDPRNTKMSEDAVIRIVFGTDEAARAIDALPHKLNSVDIYFVDKQSEAWVQKEALSDETLDMLIKVFVIYGQAGCTSPKRIVILNGTRDDARILQNRLNLRWPKVIKSLPRQHVASENVMTKQWALALGWEAENVLNNAATIAVGDLALSSFSSLMSLKISWGTPDEAILAIPDNIQTIGYAFVEEVGEDWIQKIAPTPIKRFVPISAMHQFSYVWDGYAFWQQLFERVNIQ